MNKLLIGVVSIICIIVIGIMAQDMLHEQALLENKTNTTLLSRQLDMGATHLYVKDLKTVKDFYTTYVDLEVLDTEDEVVILGHDNREIIALEQSDYTVASAGSAGLYHNAIVFSSRGELARKVQKLIAEKPELYVGTADHLVSEAFYFNDPEGNGLELYFDKDKSVWQWENGKIKMGSEYIDPAAYIQQYASEYESTEKHMGHVHLKVGSIEQAKEFYVTALGFDITADMGSALFVSVGGYHHHLGLNMWESAGAGKRSSSLGLKSFELILDSEKDVTSLKKRLDDHGIDYKEVEGAVRILDPWNNEIIVRG